jgi:antitoxin CptB
MNQNPSDIAARRRRVLYRATHRGTFECDLLLGRFAAAWVGTFDEAALTAFEALLDCPDADLLDWISGRAEPPPPYRTPVLEALRKFYAS